MQLIIATLLLIGAVSAVPSISLGIVSAARSLIVSAARSLIVSAARSLTCRDDLDSKWRLLLAENELSRVSLLSRISFGN